MRKCVGQKEPRGYVKGDICMISILIFVLPALINRDCTFQHICIPLPCFQRFCIDFKKYALPPDLDCRKPVFPVKRYRRNICIIFIASWRQDPGKALDGSDLPETDSTDNIREIRSERFRNSFVAYLKFM